MKPPHEPVGELGEPKLPDDINAARTALDAAPRRRYIASGGGDPFASGPVLAPIRGRLDSPRAARWSAFMAHALQGLLAAPPEARDGRTEAAPLAALYADEALRLHDVRFGSRAEVTAPAPPLATRAATYVGRDDERACSSTGPGGERCALVAHVASVPHTRGGLAW